MLIQTCINSLLLENKKNECFLHTQRALLGIKTTLNHTELQCMTFFFLSQMSFLLHRISHMGFICTIIMPWYKGNTETELSEGDAKQLNS